MTAPIPRDSRFETLFAHSPFSMQLVSVDGRTLRVNRAWEALWAVSDGDGVKDWVLSGGYNLLSDPQLESKGVAALLRRAFGGEHVDIPPILYDPAELGRSGRSRWVRAGAHPLFDEAGRVVEVLVIHEDVTDRFRSERALQDSEQRLRLATDAARIGIWDWDISADAVMWTPEVYELHGMKPGTFGGTARDFADRVHPEDLAWLWPRIEQAVAEGTGFTAEFRVVLPKGGDRWLSTSGKVYRGPDERARMVGATFSIDAYKKAEAALRDSDRRKDEFLAMLAHELRNPLAPIRSAAEVLLMAEHDAARVRKASEVIARQVGHVTKLLDDLLDVSRVTRGLVALHPEPVELAHVVHNAIEQAMPLIQARGHSLQTRVSSQSVAVMGDRARLVQVVVNLLNNAARYTPHSGRIEIDLDASGSRARIVVADNGQGIEPELLPHLFDVFTQGPRNIDRSQGGLGIGLALVLRLVQLHGGSVHAHSDGKGKGSRFVIELPLAEGVTQRAPAAPAAPGPGPELRVCIVDDNRDAADTLAALVELAGHTVRVHYEARDALSSALADVQVFVIDIGLPDMDGLELGRRLKAINPRARYIVASGYAQPVDIEQSRAAGFRHHLVKPVTWDALAPLLANEASTSPA
jgi:signal transduction histidine kinase